MNRFGWYQYHAAGLGTFFTWMLTLCVFGRLPGSAGVYIVTFRKVTINILKFFFVYTFIFIAFTTSFYILFPGNIEFQNSLPASFVMVSTVVPMIGML